MRYARGRSRRLLATSLSALMVLTASVFAGTASADADEPVEYLGGTLRMELNNNFEYSTSVLGSPIPDGSTFRVPSELSYELPEDPAYDWLGAEGATGYLMPGVESPPRDGNAYQTNIIVRPRALNAVVPGSVTFNLTDVVAPAGGTYSLFDQGGKSGRLLPPVGGYRLGTGQQADGSPQERSFAISTNTIRPAHAFSAEGVYCVSYRLGYVPSEGVGEVTHDTTLRFAVGDNVAADAPCGGTPEEYPVQEPEPEEPIESPKVTIGGVAFQDTNRNGVRDAGEDGLADVRLALKDSDGRVVRNADGSEAIAVTDDQGGYVFAEYPALSDSQHYRVETVNRPSGWNPTTSTRLRTTSPLSADGAEQLDLNFGFAEAVDGAIRVVRNGHADLLWPELEGSGADAEMRLRAHADDLQPKTVEYDDLVVFVGDHEKQQISQEQAYLGATGATVWTSKHAGSDPWIGMASQSGSLLEQLGSRAPLNFRLEAVTGANGAAAPGDVVIWGGSQPQHPQIFFSTREGLPKALPYAVNNHTHMNWTFSSSGVYCLAFSAEAEHPDAGRLRDNGLLTLVVGDDIDPNTVTPCARTSDYPKAGSRSFLDSDASAPLVFGPDQVGILDDQVQRLLVEGDADGLNASLLYNTDHPGGKLTRASIDNAILHGPSLRESPGTRSPYPLGSIALDLSETGRQSTGDITWRITDIKGPGDISMKRDFFQTTEDFNTAAGKTEATFWAGSSMNSMNVQATRPGKYCVAMEWESADGTGETTGDEAVLTLAVDGPLDPQDFRYDTAAGGYVNDGEVWRAADQGALDATCAQDPDSWTRASEVPLPDEVPEEPEEQPWHVPNWSKTESGARILNLGHVDVASLVADGRLDTKIKDTTEEGIEAGKDDGWVSWHEPEDVVFQLLPNAEATVSDREELRFLGESGSRIWRVNDTQDFELLWPGWSTEHIARGVVPEGVEWKLTGKDGPGEFFLYQDASDTPTPFFNTADGIADGDVFTIPERTHAHGTWAFTAEGVYCLAFERSAVIDGERQTDPFTLAVAVGETDPTKADPKDCSDSEPAVTVPQDPAKPDASADGDAVTVRWKAPADGGSAITGYTVQLLGGDRPLVEEVAADATEVVFEGVPAGTYTARVVAVNEVGASGASQASDPVTVENSDGEDPGTEDPGAEDPGTEDPGADDPEDQVTPVPDSELTDANRGGVDVPEAAVPGQRIAVKVGEAHAGEQVRVWLHSDPVLLGTVALDANGNTVVTIPTGAVLGDHRVAVQELDGSLIGWDGIRIEKASQVGPNGEWLAGTGSDPGFLFPLTAGATILLLLGGVILIGAAQQRRGTTEIRRRRESGRAA